MDNKYSFARAQSEECKLSSENLHELQKDLLPSLQTRFHEVRESELIHYMENNKSGDVITLEEACTRFSWEIQNDKHSLVDNKFGKVFTIWINTDNIPYITIDVERFY